MDRRTFLSSCCLAASGLAGCVEFKEESETTPQTDDDEDSPFIEEGETPESDGAEEFLETVAEVTGGRTGFHGKDDAPRVLFSEDGDTWTIKYYGDYISGEPLREEIAELSTAFTSHRPDGVSLEAVVLHECTTGAWEVSADTAAAYDRGELDREAFVDRVYESVETENNC
jgi:hypothetical protein